MTIIELLGQLRRAGAKLSAENETIRIQAPDGAVSAELQAEVQNRQGEILQFLRKAQAQGKPRPSITLQPRTEAGLPLSFTQYRLWFLDQLQGGSATYNVPAIFRMRGALDEAALQKSMEEIVRRHESLRTTFVVVDAEPRQMFVPSLEVPLTSYDLSSLEEVEREAQAHQLLLEEVGRPFDLAKGPLIRTTLIRLQEQEHLFIVNLHHIITDGWSMGVFFNELHAAYEAFVKKQPLSLPPVALQYADYAAWQREQVGTTLEQSMSYWRNQLAGVPAMLELPFDSPRSSVQTYNGELHTFRYSAELLSAVKKLGLEAGTTLYMTLLAAFKTLLYRLTGQGDIVLGSVVANRNRADLQGTIGFFANTLPLRTQLTDELTFRDVLEHVRQTCLQGFAHGEVPLEKLVEEFAAERNASYSPLIQALCILQPEATPIELPGLVLEPIELENGTAKFDFTLAFEESADELLGVLEYNTDLFRRETVAAWMKRLERLLLEVTRDPDQQVARVSLLSEDEHRLLTTVGNSDVVAYRRDESLVQLFEKQVLRNSDRVAVVYEQERLTYDELNRRANRLAHFLRAEGVRSGVMVGLSVERSLDMVVSILAILKAGGAYVPIDPAVPEDRIAFIAEDANVALLLTQERVRDKLPVQGANVICIEEILAAAGSGVNETDANLEVDVRPDDLAYVIYTSGSTGRPKGVLINHENVVSLFAANEAAYGFDQQDVWTMFHSYAFDFSVWELWGALLYGGKLVVVPYGVSRSPELFYELLCTEQVTVLNQTPSAFRQLVQVEEMRGVSPELALRYVIFGGEALELQSLQPWYERHDEKHPQLVNMYGITETTVHVTYRPITLEDVRSGAGSVIGKAMPGWDVYVLDRYLQPVPVGVIGEMYVGGLGVARGYLNRPELTEERFLPHPFSDAPEARLYKSGDLARVLPDGSLQYHGRIDNQVKIRGFRIELGEIEQQLVTHPAIRNAVVVVRDDNAGDKRLVAYLVAELSMSTPETTELRQYLGERLPEYMVPSVFVELDSIPLTSNGKVDHKALPVPVLTQRDEEQPFVAPRNETEAKLATIWCEVLQVERVGVYDNFFALGGNSFSAVRVIMTMEAQFGMRLPTIALFQAPTLSELAGRLNTQSSVPSRPSLAVLPRSTEVGLPLSFTQYRLWFLDQLQPGTATYNVPVIYRMSGMLNRTALQKSIDEIVRRHESLRTTFAVVNAEPRQMFTQDLEVPLNVQDISLLAEDERDVRAQKLLVEEVNRPFDLAQGPLIRTTLIRLQEQEHIFIVNMHHVITDGWSMGILLGELRSAYEAFVKEQPLTLPEVTMQYADYAAWQREHLEHTVLEQQMEYWHNQLAGIPAMLELPFDSPRSSVQTFNGDSHYFQFSRELLESVKKLGLEAGTTLYMTLLAAFKTLLYRLTGQEDIVLGTVVANRNHADVEGTIGFFANTLPLRTQLSEELTFREVLERVRQTCMQGFANSEVPLDKLVERFAPERNASYSPLIQALCILQPEATPMEFPGLTLEAIEMETGTAKFDFTLAFEEGVEGLGGSIEYNTDLFRRETVEKWLECLERLLLEVTRDPDQQVARVSLLSEDEHRVLTTAGNSDVVAYSRDESLVQLFEEQVLRNSDRVAVVYENEQLTYAELNRRANRVAHFLRAEGVQSGVMVGLSVERSLDMVVSILAILKAGGAYVPIDPAVPEDRIAFIAEDANVALLLTQERVRDKLPVQGANVICIEEILAAAGYEVNETEANLEVDVRPDDLAYVIYTSGSTGRPKGVLINHENVVSLFAANEAAYGFDQQDVWTMFHSYAFDFSVWELWGALLYGGKLVVVPYGVSRSPELFYELLCTEQVTVLNQTPSAFRQLIQVEEMRGVSPELALRYVIFGGEALELQSLQPWYERHDEKHPQLVNMYGITETTVHVTYRPITLEDVRSGAGSVIGKAMPGWDVYVLDRYLQPVPVGVVGEMYVGGLGVARGYLNRPELTEERFLPHPFSKESGARLYKSGDLARLLPDGSLQYQGRIDNQVKIRGFRIELGEIEHQLVTHPAIRNAVVVVRDDNAGDKRLVAYLVAELSMSTPETTDLRHYLGQRLPEYMIPSVCVELDSIPLTSNGKVDHKALPVPELTQRDEEQPFVAPRTETEARLVDIWRAVLQVERVGVHDNFFALGGNSFSAVRVMMEIEAQLAERLPTITIFQAPTVAELTARLTTHESRVKSTLVTLQPNGTKRPLYFLPPVGGDLHGYLELIGLFGDETPLYGFVLPGLYGDSVPYERVEDIAAHFIRDFQQAGHAEMEVLIGWSMGGNIAFEMANQWQALTGATPTVLLLDSYVNPFVDEDMQNDAALTTMFLEDLLRLTGHDRPEEQELANQGEAAFEQIATLLHMESAQLHQLLAVFQANMRALRHYAPQGNYAGDMLLLTASEETVDTSLTRGWDRLLSSEGELTVKQVPGDHYSFLRTPHVQRVIEEINMYIKRVEVKSHV